MMMIVVAMTEMTQTMKIVMREQANLKLEECSELGGMYRLVNKF